MSLIHDALKKAEKENGASDPTTVKTLFVDEEEIAKESSNKRAMVLLVLVIVGLGFITYTRFFKKSSSQIIASKSTVESIPITVAPNAAQLLKESEDLIRQQRYEDARAKLEKAIFLGTQSAEAYNNLGYILKKIGKNDEALTQYQKAVSIDPQCVQCLNNLGVLYLSNRDLSEAEPRFQKAIEIKPDYADPYLHLALLQEARGNSEDAKRNYLKFTQLAQNVGADFLLKVQERIAALH